MQINLSGRETAVAQFSGTNFVEEGGVCFAGTAAVEEPWPLCPNRSACFAVRAERFRAKGGRAAGYGRREHFPGESGVLLRGHLRY